MAAGAAGRGAPLRALLITARSDPAQSSAEAGSAVRDYVIHQPSMGQRPHNIPGNRHEAGLAPWHERLLRASAEFMPPQQRNDSFGSTIPRYDGSAETPNGILMAVLEMKEADAVADGLSIVTSEYNSNIRGVVACVRVRWR